MSMVRVSPTQIDKNGFKAGDRVLIKSPIQSITIIGRLIKLILDDLWWITIFETTYGLYGFHAIIRESYAKDWNIDSKYIGMIRADINPDNIISLAIKKRCEICSGSIVGLVATEN